MAAAGDEGKAVEKLESGGAAADVGDATAAVAAAGGGVKYRGWGAMPYIIGNETFEKLGTLGTSSNLLVYLTAVFHMPSVDAAALLNAFNGTTSLAPIAGAFLSDAFLGRYSTLAFASIASLLVCPSVPPSVPPISPPANVCSII